MIKRAYINAPLLFLSFILDRAALLRRCTRSNLGLPSRQYTWGIHPIGNVWEKGIFLMECGDRVHPHENWVAFPVCRPNGH